MLTNYDLLLFLAADKGYYTRKQHLEVLTKKYPDEKITLSRVSTLRASIINSNLIKEKVKIVNYIKAIRVVSVDEQFKNYSFKRPDEPKQNLMESYLLSEQPETENALRNAAREAIKEYRNPENTLTYRQILDKHAADIARILPKKYPAWMWLNYACHEVYAEK